ncbi:RNase adapter protein RapZ [hydrothermal vent metagenome]|uniref:RNase adapter protein RapZ n=1 Tax=hydrothermal vent metagenome TaxID=652676 RepID=A0A3B1AUY5_9ZZZZ
MKLIIISGLSGSGKSIALNVLEDLHYYCIDNLPAAMLPALADQLLSSGNMEREHIAVGIDARNTPADLADFSNILKDLQSRQLEIEIFFLEADTPTLIKRFSETRRRHPLSSDEVPLSEAIAQERSLLQPIAGEADLHMDTSRTNIHQLRELIHSRVNKDDHSQLSLLFESFGFKQGIPVDADFVFDVRCIPNPHWEPRLRSLTGRDPAVAEFLELHDDAVKMFDDIRHFLESWVPRFEADNRSYMTVAIGCTGGQHRSVYMVEKLAAWFKQQRPGILHRHRELS